MLRLTVYLCLVCLSIADSISSCTGHDSSSCERVSPSSKDGDDDVGLLQVARSRRSTAPELVEKAIPRIIWQTWHDEDMPAAYAKNARNIRKNNPTFDYRLVTDAEATEFLDEYFPGNVSHAFHALLNTSLGAARADVLRYALLYTYGGVYIDLDASCTNLEFYIHESDSALLSHEDWWANRWIQWVLMIEPNHPVMKRALEIAVDRLNSGFPADIPTMHEAVVWTTGPLAFSAALKEFDTSFYDNQVQEAWHDDFGVRAIGERLQLRACDEPSCAWKRIGKIASVSYRPMCKEFAATYTDPKKYDKTAMPTSRHLVTL